jgi:hypothetical protein
MVQAEATDTFSKRAHHFMGTSKTLSMFSDQDKHLEAANAESKALTTTVGAKLGYIQKDIARWWDAFLQKEATNQAAVADLVIDGEMIAEGLPAAGFLGMEKELKALRKVYEAIPTLAPGVKWEKDESLTAQDDSKGVYVSADPEKKLKTKQTVQHKILVPATEHHPAQIEKWAENQPIGQFTSHLYSGMITPAEKSALLQKLSKLITAVKKARQRANATEVKKVDVGKALFKYIHSGE